MQRQTSKIRNCHSNLKKLVFVWRFCVLAMAARAVAGTNRWDETHRGTVDDMSDEQREVRALSGLSAFACALGLTNA